MNSGIATLDAANMTYEFEMPFLCKKMTLEIEIVEMIKEVGLFSNLFLCILMELHTTIDDNGLTCNVV